MCVMGVCVCVCGVWCVCDVYVRVCVASSSKLTSLITASSIAMATASQMPGRSVVATDWLTSCKLSLKQMRVSSPPGVMSVKR